MISPENLARRERMADLYLNHNMRLAEIGFHYGLTRERVRQILSKVSQYHEYRVDYHARVLARIENTFKIDIPFTL